LTFVKDAGEVVNTGGVVNTDGIETVETVKGRTAEDRDVIELSVSVRVTYIV
jgi:hypothetical protein